MNDALYPKGAIKCLDKGFIRLVDSMGSDDAIVQAARVSYGKGTTKVSRDRGLIRYLLRHRHSTPFEMVELKFHAKMPIFVARQWTRHRTANINEYSLRYSEAHNDFYIPEKKNIHFQSQFNKQGRDNTKVPPKLKGKVVDYFNEISEKTFSIYNELNEAGVARELARGILPVNLYTEWYWKNDLHNIFHFLRLRMDEHAQYEIRVFAKAMASFVKKVVPIAYEAFEDYAINGLYFSKFEKDLITTRLPNRILDDLKDEVIYRIVATLNENKNQSNEKLYHRYQQNGGFDCEEDFNIKWKTGNIEKGNVFEMREFLLKIEKLKSKN
jgi:thymidylate synthase (FAD)